jgi:excisionase family DNA binding protein
MNHEYVPLTQAANLLGISLPALRRRIDRGQLSVYRSPTDLRVRLIRRKDLERYSAPASTV